MVVEVRFYHISITKLIVLVRVHYNLEFDIVFKVYFPNFEIGGQKTESDVEFKVFKCEVLVHIDSGCFYFLLEVRVKSVSHLCILV